MSAGMFGPKTAFASTYLESTLESTAAWPIAAGEWGDFTSLALTPGEWDIQGVILINNNGAVTASNVNIGISSTAGNSGTGMTFGLNLFVTFNTSSSGSASTLLTPRYRVNISANTTYYLKGRYSQTTTNVQYLGYGLTARKVA